MNPDDLAKHLTAAKTREEAIAAVPAWMKGTPIEEQTAGAWENVQELAAQRDELIKLKPWKTAQYNQEFGVEVLRIAAQLDGDLKDGTVAGV